MAQKIVLVNFRVSRRDASLLALLAARAQRSRSDTLRLLIRSAAAELDNVPGGSQGAPASSGGQGVGNVD